MTDERPPGGLLSDDDLAALRAWHTVPATSPGPCPVCGGPRDVRRYDRNNGIIWACKAQSAARDVVDARGFDRAHYSASWVEILKPRAGMVDLLNHIDALAAFLDISDALAAELQHLYMLLTPEQQEQYPQILELLERYRTMRRPADREGAP